MYKVIFFKPMLIYMNKINKGGEGFIVFGFKK